METFFDCDHFYDGIIETKSRSLWSDWYGCSNQNTKSNRTRTIEWKHIRKIKFLLNDLNQIISLCYLVESKHELKIVLLPLKTNLKNATAVKVGKGFGFCW